MNNQLVIREEQDFEIALRDVENMQKMCTALMKTKHYQSMGEVGIFAILQKAKSVGLNPLDALNGSIYFVSGKTELSSNAMNYLIRRAGHSITKDSKSDKTICVLNGKRVDNGDTWQTSFSIEDAKKAGIYKNTWDKYPEDMLFARALSRLARQLFPDVIKGCYTEGEIRDGVIDNPRSVDIMKVSEFVEIGTTETRGPLIYKPPVEPIKIISKDQLFELEDAIGADQEYRDRVAKGLKEKFGIDSFDKIPELMYPKVLASVAKYQYEKSQTVKPDEQVDLS